MSLARQQALLLQALALPRHADAMELIADSALAAGTPGRNDLERGLQAYRSQAQALAVRTLSAAYPVVAQLLGEENFEALARSLWRQHPPARGDLAQWGGQLPAYIEEQAALAQEEPYLADVARAEWALHAIATAPDGEADPGSLALLASADPARLALVLSPGATCIASAYPVASILGAHLEGEPSLEEAGRRLRAGEAQTALAWRQGFKPRLRRALPHEAAFIAALQERRPLLDSLAAAPGLDFQAWLPLAAQTGLLLAARDL